MLVQVRAVPKHRSTHISNYQSTERTTPPSSAHVQLDDVPRTLDPAECRGRVSSARRRGDGDREVILAGLRLSTTKI